MVAAAVASSVRRRARTRRKREDRRNRAAVRTFHLPVSEATELPRSFGHPCDRCFRNIRYLSSLLTMALDHKAMVGDTDFVGSEAQGNRT